MSGASSSAAPGARRPRRRPGENRAGLIASGTVEFGLHGYAGAQTSAIAVRAGVSQPNVYANFSSKRELFLACVRELARVVEAAVLVPAVEPAPAAPAPLSEAHLLLLFQAVAAAREPQLQPELTELLEALRDGMGPDAFAGTLHDAATALLAATP